MRWRVQFYPHYGEHVVCDGPLEVVTTEVLAIFPNADDAQRFADARNLWEGTAPDPRAFQGFRGTGHERGIPIYEGGRIVGWKPD